MSPRVFRGGEGLMSTQLLKPMLRGCIGIRRATGYFTSGTFSAAPEEWRDFFLRGSTLSIVCSPHVGVEDVTGFVSALTRARRWKGQPPPMTSSLGFARNLYCWAIANGLLHISVARLKDSRLGIYHEKFGIGERADGSKFVFVGSVNESANAYLENFELAHFYEGKDSPALIAQYSESFERLWNNEVGGLEILPLHEALPAGWIVPQSATEDAQGSLNKHDELAEVLLMPIGLKMRPYQEDAITAWFANKGQGIFVMATGTGKTITSLSTALRVYQEAGGPLVLIVVAPYLVLVDQWYEIMKWFGLNPIRCAGSRQNWEEVLHASIRLANAGKREVVSLVVSNATFANSAMQGALGGLDVRTMLIADEVHNFGAEGLLSSLPERVSLRLGLTATPVRQFDEVGTRGVTEYFGKPVFELSMAQAMALDPAPLVPYTYFPHLVEFTTDEYETYRELTRRIVQTMGAEKQSALLPSTAKELLIRRARLVGAAKLKLEVLKETIKPYRNTSHILVYCGDGVVESDSDDADFQRQIEAVVYLLGIELRMQVATYTSRTSRSDRSRILDEFRAGKIQALVAIRCLDEGLDIPEVRRAFILASSSNPRQFIQRRGRVLRKAEGKEKAEIFDFFVVPPLECWDDASSLDRNLVRNEMRRALEFLSLAINKTQARSQLWNVLKRLHLLDLLGEEVEDE